MGRATSKPVVKTPVVIATPQIVTAVIIPSVAVKIDTLKTFIDQFSVSPEAMTLLNSLRGSAELAGFKNTLCRICVVRHDIIKHIGGKTDIYDPSESPFLKDWTDRYWAGENPPGSNMRDVPSYLIAIDAVEYIIGNSAILQRIISQIGESPKNSQWVYSLCQRAVRTRMLEQQKLDAAIAADEEAIRLRRQRAVQQILNPDPIADAVPHPPAYDGSSLRSNPSDSH